MGLSTCLTRKGKVYSMDEEAGYGEAINDGRAEERGAHSRQEPLMVFLTTVMELEAVLVTLEEILPEFDGIVREKQAAAAQREAERSWGMTALGRGLSAMGSGMRAVCRALSRKAGCGTAEGEDAAAPDGEQQAEWAAKRARLEGMVDETQAEVQRTLERMYVSSSFPEKCRSFPALACICDYLLSGRCNTLLGGAGACSVFEAEVHSGAAAARADEAWACRRAIGKAHPLLVQRLGQARQEAHRIALEVEQAAQGENFVHLPTWSAFAQALQQTMKPSKND